MAVPSTLKSMILKVGLKPTTRLFITNFKGFFQLVHAKSTQAIQFIRTDYQVTIFKFIAMASTGYCFFCSFVGDKRREIEPPHFKTWNSVETLTQIRNRWGDNRNQTKHIIGEIICVWELPCTINLLSHSCNKQILKITLKNWKVCAFIDLLQKHDSTTLCSVIFKIDNHEKWHKTYLLYRFGQPWQCYQTWSTYFRNLVFFNCVCNKFWFAVVFFSHTQMML